MSDRLSLTAHRIETVQQLGSVVTAMRSLAVARRQEAEQRLPAIRAYAQNVGQSIGVALALSPDAPALAASRKSGEVLILLSAEQGFTGGFCDTALDAAAAYLANSSREVTLMLLGNRGRMLAASRGLPLAWTGAMPLHVREVADVANRIAAALYQRINEGTLSHVTLLCAAPDEGAIRSFKPRHLLPFDYGRFAVKASPIPPLVTLPPATLLAMLAEEYVFAELCEALTLAHAAENEARLHAMTAAGESIKDIGEVLAQNYRQQRQEAITEEVIELASATL